MRGIIEAVLIQDERLGQGADLEEAMPVGGVARQARDFQTHHEAGAPEADIADQLLKPFAVRGRRTGLPEVAVDHDDLFDRPAERHGAVSKRILPFGALGILNHLPQRRLPHIDRPDDASGVG